MKYKLSKVLGLNEPSDGYTPEEKKLESLIAMNTIHSLYARLPTMRMRWIVSMYFELGYTQEVIAEILGIKQPTLHEEIELIKMVLMGYNYEPAKHKDEVRPEHLLKIVMSLISSHMESAKR